jgi:hypothetical protein
MNHLAPATASHVLFLETGGFRRVGCWRLVAAGDGIELDFTADREPGVYVYAVDGIAHYVGTAHRGLHGRFRRYAITKSMRTSQRIRKKILCFLAAGRVVEIYTLTPPELVWQGLPVDLIAGIEEGLIRNLRPIWNLRSNRGAK